ncbi:AMP-binding protein [Amycolatopsis taiwanensis]|uniref:Acetyl-CoA synthetase n=1 Tax=Amycolatopsis taiwanensis TaxID=342230 RepID=A0A9W6VKB0_9PSEU|nr:AMP-binding protein [Amycolatopsis taiwanensis]GLY70419.1 acetyl-CoA synthetase [Amycolatopsis taiwanensis]
MKPASELSPSAHVDTFCRDHLPPREQWPEFEFVSPELRYPERLNCATALLEDTSRRYGADRTCLISPTERWTYGELVRRSNQIAQVLTEDLGLVPGQRVLLRGPNTPWLVACWFAVVKAGAVVVTTMPMLRRAELAKLLDLTATTIVLCDHRFAEELLDAAVPGVTTVCYGDAGPDDLLARAATKSGEFTAVDTAADDVVMLAPTSGTTGTPKATMHFHRDVLAAADTFSAHIVQPRPDDVFTGTPPLGFTFGLGGLMVFPLRAGAATLLLERPGTDVIEAAVREHGATVLFTAPTAYRALLREGKTDVLAKLRRCVSAGEHLPESVWREVHTRTGIRIIDGIGATEMMHVFISSADDDILPGATGRAVPGYRAAVLDDAGQPVPDGTAGRLAVIGPTGCRYLADERQTQYVRHGWNLTGDIYVRDADGYFWYQGRADDMIVSSGYNIAGPEVEQALEQHSDVAECAVIGLPDVERGMIVHAAVVLRPDVTGNEEKKRELADHVKQILAPYKHPRSIEFRDALPRTATGKLQRHKLREERASTP